MIRRPRRNRKNQAIRNLLQENVVLLSDLISPLFVSETSTKKTEIHSMPGIYRHNLDSLLFEIEQQLNLGINAFCIFPHIEESKKDQLASESLNADGIYLKSIRTIKEKFPEVVLMTDVAMDPYSSHGHDGILKDGKILNDETLEILAAMAVAQAEAGADIVGPSDMMDGRVQYIRRALDNKGFIDVSIMSYAVKYASAFYGPFRDALDSSPKQGDKKTYQMNPANAREAILEASLDFNEGADFLMVKPALSYLDIVYKLKNNFNILIAAYNVSGEYAMVKAASQKGWLDENKIVDEILVSIKRAGADVILTYFAKDYAIKLKNNILC